MFLKNVSRVEWLVLALLISIGVASRLYLEIPNFKPVAAFVLFGGFFFRKPLLAIVGVVVLMALSDLRLESYSLPLMLSVYLSLAIAAGLGMMIRRQLGTHLHGFRWVLPFASASLVMSAVFFLLTNGAVWLTGTIYPHNLGGLVECYIAGLPFYRSTVMGDMVFTLATAGCYVLALQTFSSKENVASAVELS